MKHDHVRDRLGDYLEGALPLRDRALVDSHLDGCERCLGELGDLRATVRMLRALSAVDEPIDVTAAVMRRIAAGEAEPTWWQRLVDVVDVWARPRALVAVAVGASALAGVLIFEPERLAGDLALQPEPPRGDAVAASPLRPAAFFERAPGALRASDLAAPDRSQATDSRGLSGTRVLGLPPHVELPLLEGDPMLEARTFAELRRRGLVNPRVQSKADLFSDFMREREGGFPSGLGPHVSTSVNYPGPQ